MDYNINKTYTSVDNSYHSVKYSKSKSRVSARHNGIQRSRVTAPLICNLHTSWKHTAWRILNSIILSANVLLWVSVSEHQEEKT